MKEFTMKKGLLIGTIALVVVIAFGVVGYAAAQSLTPTPNAPFGGQFYGRGGMMGGRGGGMMGRWQQDGDEGPMHTYMVAAFAKALGMTTEDLEAEIDAGKTMWQVAQDKGLSVEEFQTLMINARTEALKAAVADGVITQAQADWMLSHMQGRGGAGGGYGPGDCPMGGGGFGRGGGRWNSPAGQPTATPSANF
jgi:hypothetical protein